MTPDGYGDNERRHVEERNKAWRRAQIGFSLDPSVIEKNRRDLVLKIANVDDETARRLGF